MADIDPPSFSLGLDLDPDPMQEPQIYSPINTAPGPSSTTILIDDCEHDSGLQVMDSDPEPGAGSPRIFKRLRRGPADRLKKKEEESDNGGDEIEDFSSQEEDVIVRGAYPSTQYNSVYSSSKVPLSGCGILTTQSSSELKEKKRKQASNVPSSSCLETGQNGLMFPKLTISPLRKFQLVDSDSDSEEPSINKDVSRNTPRTDSSLKVQQPTAREQKRDPSAEKNQGEDLWKDFRPMKSFRIPTPALDEVCEEYFQSVRDKNAAQKLGSNVCKRDSAGCNQDANIVTGFEQCLNLADPLPPAYHYFFHDDPRIRALVRCRLPNFSPLGTVGGGNQKPSEPVINYMNQFNGAASKQGGTKGNSSGKASARGRNKTKKSNAKEVMPASQGWRDPKSSATIPKDAGKRRVHANGQAAGHWYTSPEGRKVYVSRTGEELTGQVAYRHYRKESGGFRKSRKKANVKRKKG